MNSGQYSEGPLAEGPDEVGQRNRKGVREKFLLLFIGLVVIVAIGGIYTSWVFWGAENGARKEAKQAIEQIQVSAVAEFAEAAVDQDSDAKIEVYGATSSDVFFDESIGHYVAVKSPGVGWAGSILSETVDVLMSGNDLARHLKRSGFSEYSPGPFEEGFKGWIVPHLKQVYLIKDDIVCSLVSRTKPEKENRFSCVQTEHITSHAQRIEPIYNAYTAALGYNPKVLLSPSWDGRSVSPSGDYEVMWAGATSGGSGGGQTVFYRARDGGTWRLAHHGQEPPSCEQDLIADHEEAQEALADFGCFTPSNHGLVMPTVAQYYDGLKEGWSGRAYRGVFFRHPTDVEVADTKDSNEHEWTLQFNGLPLEIRKVVPSSYVARFEGDGPIRYEVAENAWVKGSGELKEYLCASSKEPFKINIPIGKNAVGAVLPGGGIGTAWEDRVIVTENNEMYVIQAITSVDASPEDSYTQADYDLAEEIIDSFTLLDSDVIGEQDKEAKKTACPSQAL